MSKERLEKSERTPPVSWCPWALAYRGDRPYNFSCLSAVSKNRGFAVFSRFWGVIWRGKAFTRPAMPVSNKKQEFERRKANCSMTVGCVRTNLILPEAPASSTVDVNSRFSRFQILAFWSNGLASSVFLFAPILLRCYFIVFVWAAQWLKCFVTAFLINFDRRKKLCLVNDDRAG